VTTKKPGSRRHPLAGLWALCLPLCPPAFAAALHVPQVQVGPPVEAMYRCPGGKSFRVTYFNGSNGQSFALLPVDRVPQLLVATASADGVRYQSGFVTWWSKGRQGDYYDTRKDPDRPLLRGCVSK